VGPADLPEAIVFDLDGTIVDTETVDFESIRDVWAQYGVEYTVGRFEHIVGTAVGADWVAELTTQLGDGVDVSHAHNQRQMIKQQMLQLLRTRPGIDALMNAAAVAGVPMAVASNSPLDWVRARLDHLQLARYLSAIITIDIASHPKPHPAPFLEACAAVGANPARSIAFEDSATGVESARAAGLYTIACPCPLTIGHDLSAADRVVSSHAEITLADLGRAVRARPPTMAAW
jgi:HAD superfamily hydrolase (TIGR01509 family)